jgi:mitogen-activated protein kinase 1/3
MVYSLSNYDGSSHGINLQPPISPKEERLVLDLLGKLLAFNPAKRISANAALDHPLFVNLHAAEDAPDFPEGAKGDLRRDFEFESLGEGDAELLGMFCA